MAILATFFSCNKGQENVFYDILERKNAFLGYKNKKFKTSKNSHGFGPNMAILGTLIFLGIIGQENVLRYSRKHKRLSRL